MKFSSVFNLLSRPLWLVMVLFAMGISPAWAVFSCSVTATSTGVLYIAPTPQDSQGVATLTCTREGGDPNTLSYRLKAGDGLNVNRTQRNVRLGLPANDLSYSLQSTAGCANGSNWYAPATGIINVVTGILNFGAALSQSVNVPYCLRIRVGTAGNANLPPAGVYTDTINIFGQFPDSDAGVLTAFAPITYSVGVNNQCVFNSSPTAMLFNYSAFNPTVQTAVSTFNLRCSNGLRWMVTVSPASAAVIGLNYGIAVSPSVTTIGTGLNQLVTLTGTMAAGQAGTCALGTCTGTQIHTVTIEY